MSEKSSKLIGISIVTMILTAIMLVIVNVKVPRPMLIVERFYPGYAWLEIVLLSIYAGFLVRKILDDSIAIKWRTILWLTFSIVFYGQLFIGLLGVEQFLMSGKLHLPLPALILGGPIFRGEGFFMTILFSLTLIFIGPAWCSYFCYLGGWDFLASQKLKRPKKMVAWRQRLRLIILFTIIFVALAMRYSGVSVVAAVWLASVYGVGAILVMWLFSRKQGNMVHCTTYCPIGAIANIAGKISPFRVNIDSTCDICGKCTMKCRYDALSIQDVRNGYPGSSCTYCGDCMTVCKNKSIGYRFPGLSSQTAREFFAVLVVTFHAVSLGVAMI